MYYMRCFDNIPTMILKHENCLRPHYSIMRIIKILDLPLQKLIKGDYWEVPWPIPKHSKHGTSYRVLTDEECMEYL